MSIIPHLHVQLTKNLILILMLSCFPSIESIAKKRADTTDELAEIEGQFRSGESNSNNRQSKNGNAHQNDSNDNHDASNKHNRRDSMDEDDEEDADDHSPFHQSDDQDQTMFEHSIVEPDLSLLKTENVDEPHANSIDRTESHEIEEPKTEETNKPTIGSVVKVTVELSTANETG